MDTAKFVTSITLRGMVRVFVCVYAHVCVCLCQWGGGGGVINNKKIIIERINWTIVYIYFPEVGQDI